MKILTLLFSLFLLFSCNGQEKKEMLENYQYKTSKRTFCGMDLTIPGPFELYIYNIKAPERLGRQDA